MYYHILAISQIIECPPLCRSLEQGARQPGSYVTREALSTTPPPPRPAWPPGAPGRLRRRCAAPAASDRGRPPPGGPPARRRGRPAPLRAGPAPAGAAGGRPAEPLRVAEAAIPVAVRALSIRWVLMMLCQLLMIYMSSSVHAIPVAGALGFPRYGSSPTPFGGLGSLRDSPLNPADPFGALAPRPGFPPSTSAGVWPLKVRMPEQNKLYYLFVQSNKSIHLR